MVNFRVLGIAALVVSSSLLTTGCSVRALQLESQPMTFTGSIDPSHQSDKKLLIYPLEERRGAEYSYIFPSSWIPVVNFFHIGGDNKYPETSGAINSSQGGSAAILVGDLSAAFPYLLANAIREMRLTPNATPIEQVNSKTDLRTFDYIVRGKLTKSRLEMHYNLIPLAVLGILGMPYTFYNSEFEIEVSISSAANPDVALLTKTYTHKDSRVQGLYYNHDARYQLFVGVLEKMLPDMVTDLSAQIKK